MDETKKMLRSILVSSPLTIDVSKLNRDFREVAGYEIPYRELGYGSLLAFLNAIPDVLRVNGNSMYSAVTLIVSEKTAHVNDMVLKQRRKGYAVGGFYAPKRRGNSRFGEPSRMTPKKNYVVTSPRYSNPSHQLQGNFYTKTNQTLHSNKMESHKIVNTKITQPLDLDLKLKEYTEVKLELENNEQKSENTQLLKRLNYKEIKLDDESSRIPNLLDIQFDMTNVNNLKTSGTKNDDKHLLRRLNYNEQQYSNSTSFIPSVTEIENDIKNSTFSKDDLLNKDASDFMRQLLLRKDTLKVSSERNLIANNNSFPQLGNIEKDSLTTNIEEKYILESRIPREIQDNLRELMSDFPNGIWCTQMPTEYRKKFRKELDYEELGFRCLINMCMDLENIFHCSKESSYDFKLYDVRKPVPRVRILEDQHIYISDHSRSSAGLLEDDAVPKVDWSTYAHLLPEGAVGLDVEIPRDFVNLATKKSDIYFVVVAEIYDPSKFWLYKNDGELDGLMDEMQHFYQENKQRYQIPENLLETGLYCVVVTLNEYHRAVIVTNQRANSFVNVFFIDYGSLGTAPKNEVWFLTKNFIRLPAQAIRARLADIYPPTEYTTWNIEATSRFRSLASMKQLEAKISKIIPDKKIIEVYLENPNLAPGRDINSILVQEGYALHTNQARAMCIEDPHCIPRVKFVHLFPDFEEIEYWLAPSIEQMAEFANTDLTADFFFPQYFTRPIDKNLHNKIESKAKKLIKRKEKPVKWLDVRNLGSMRDVREVMKVAYGDFYEQHKEELDESVQQYYKHSDYEEKDDEELKEEGDDLNCGDYENLLNKLRSKSLNSKDVENKKVDLLSLEDLTNYSDRNYLTANKEKYDNEDIYKSFYGCFEDKVRGPTISSSARKDTSGVEKYLSQLDKWGNLSELEKYLSEEEQPSTPSTNNGKLIDLDDAFHPACQSRHSSKSISLDLSLNQSNSSSKGHRRRNRFSLLSDSSSSDVEESGRVGNRYRQSREKQGSSVCSDLIKLDVVLDCPILTPHVVENSGSLPKPKFSDNSVDNVSDADDEDDSDSRLNPHAKEFVLMPPKSKDTPRRISLDKHVQINEFTQTDTDTVRVSSSSNDHPLNSYSANSDSNALCSVSSMSLNDRSDVRIGTNATGSSVSPIEPRLDASRNNDVSSSSDLTSQRRYYATSSNSAVATRPPPGLGPPPGFGPVPRYSQCKDKEIPQSGCYVYQPWSTIDCMGNGLQMNLQMQQNRINVPMNGMGFTSQPFVAQVSSMYRYPFLVIPCNGLPPMPPSGRNEGFAQPHVPINMRDMFYSDYPAPR